MRELEQKLKREGFTNVLSHLSGPSIRRQINDLMAKAPQPRD
jgi:Holliday junction resolvase